MFECTAKYFNGEDRRIWTTDRDRGLELLRDYARERGTVIVDWNIEDVKEKEQQ